MISKKVYVAAACSPFVLGLVHVATVFASYGKAGAH
jgi:hypothetical protein